MTKTTAYWVLIFIFLFLFPVVLWARMESTNFAIEADVFSSGGLENSSSANYSLQDTIGEALIASATSTSASYGIKAGFREMYVGTYLTLSVSANSVDLGTLTLTSTGSVSHTMTIDTNSSSGFTTTVSGNTLESGANDINAIGASATAASAGTEQFGINLVANATPAIGADPSGSAPIGSAADQYNLTDNFAFNSGDTVATSTTSINTTVYAVSYMANIALGTALGSYSTTLTYSATVNP